VLYFCFAAFRMSKIKMNPDFQVEIISDFRKLEEHVSDWTRLWSLSPCREVFGTLEWARASWRAYGGGRRLYTPIVRRGDAVIGIWPLALKDRCLQPIGTPHSDYNDMLCAAEDAKEVFRAVLQTIRRKGRSPWKKGRVENIPENGSLWRAAHSLLNERKEELYLTAGSICSKIVFEDNESFIAERILGNKHLRRKQNRLSKFGAIEFQHIEDREKIKTFLPDFFRQHIERRELLRERSMFADSRERYFYHCLVEELDPRSVLRFGVLTLDGRPIGYHLGFETGKKLVSYKPTFDVQYAKWSPGEVLFKKVFEYVAERRLKECDLTVGVEEFKNRFANVMSRNWSLFFFPPGLPGSIRLKAEQMKDWIRKHPSLYGALRPLWKIADRDIGM
jgi:CelD/BcsL family acetyltransferase involved in cellulose biosynthesis